MNDDFWDFIKDMMREIDEFFSGSEIKRHGDVDIQLNPANKELYVTMPLQGLHIESISYDNGELIIQHKCSNGKRHWKVIPLASKIKQIKSYTFKNGILDIVMEVET